MKRVIVCFSIFSGLVFLGMTFNGFAKETEVPESTQGIELSGEIETKATPEQKNDWKQKRKENKQYFKTKNALKKADYKKLQQEKELKYLEKRLELKQKRLESLNPNQEQPKNESTEEMKGEKEE